MAEFNECMHKDLPKERFEQLRDETMRAIQDFFVSLVFNDKLCGSGTLVDAIRGAWDFDCLSRREGNFRTLDMPFCGNAESTLVPWSGRLPTTEIRSTPPMNTGRERLRPSLEQPNMELPGDAADGSWTRG